MKDSLKSGGRKAEVGSMETSLQAVTAFCDLVSRAVVNAAPALVRANVDRTVELCRRETLAFLSPESDVDGKYADARECARRGSVNERYLVALVVAEVVGGLSS